MTPLLVVLVTASLHAGPRPMNFRVSEKADRIAPTFVLDLKPDVPHTFETRNVSKGSDTVLVILDDVRPLDWNDDRDVRRTDRKLPTESFLRFSARRRAPYSIQVRAKDGTLEGECDLYLDGKLLGRRLKFGARHRLPKPTPGPFPRPVRSFPAPVADIYELPRPWR